MYNYRFFGASGTYDYVWQTKGSGASAVDRLKITGNADTADVLITNSNVGIGTTSPSEVLDVIGDIEASGVIQTGGITGTAYSAISDSGTADIAASDNDLYIEDILEVDGFHLVFDTVGEDLGKELL